MSQNEQNLIWLDMEMTGLEPETDRILEIAMIVTDKELNILAEGPVLAIHQSDEVLAGMDEWNTRTHGESGLVARVRASECDEAKAIAVCLEFMKEWVPERQSPMCGNSVCQDRRFLNLYMPKLEAFFHYRHLDVSTLKILAQNWAPQVFANLSKGSNHRALDDIIGSIDELKYYRQHLLKV